MAAVSDSVRSFLQSFLQAIKESNVAAITNHYDQGWARVTEKLYKQSEWPSGATIAPVVNNDELFVLLYNEMCFRHVYTRLSGSLTSAHRAASWEGYKALFDWFLARTEQDLAQKVVPDELPALWLWDMIDEFLYQTQEFSGFSYKIKTKTEDELQVFKEHASAWNILTVMKYLQAFVDKSKIVETLNKERAGHATDIDPASGNGTVTFDRHQVYRTLGYFSVIGLVRLHTQLGDYNLALKTLAPISLNKKGVYTKVIACYVTLYYYTGCIYMMLRRFPDAIRTFSHILLYISRIKQFHTKSYQQEAIVKKNEHMYALLAILISFCPQRVDEHVSGVLRDRYQEKMLFMQRGDMTVVEELFSYACPKFVSPLPVNLTDENAPNHNQEVQRLQIKLFVNEIKQQSLLPVIRSYLKLYTTIGMDKLSNLLERKVDEDVLSKILLCYNHKTRGLASASGDASADKVTSYSDIAFFIDNNMIHIMDTKAPRRYGDYFVRKSNQFEEIVDDLLAHSQ